jgi:hypothetical protein
MRPEDLGKFFDDAIEKIAPQNEAHREQLDRLREALCQINETTKQAFQDLGQQMERLADSGEDDERRVQLADEAVKVARETRHQIAAAFEVQAGIIKGIAQR